MAPERPDSEGRLGVALVQRSATNPPTERPPATPSQQTPIKEGDGATGQRLSEDDELTSLSWLQDENLLKGLRPELRASPTSDFVEESRGSSPGSVISQNPPPQKRQVASSSSTLYSTNSQVSTIPLAQAKQPVSTASRTKHPQHVPYDPLVHLTSKPPYSFSCLIFMAIEDSPQRALPVKEIYSWILLHFPYFQSAPTGWKNSVRHNLSLNKCFCKVEKGSTLGKGSLWMVDPPYRSNLLQALQKAPFHPYTSQDRLLPSGQSLKKLERISSEVQPNEAISNENSSPTRLLPNPELFPYLSRRLASTKATIPDLASTAVNNSSRVRRLSNRSSSTSDAESLDDVDAAAAMLVLKHGHTVFNSPRKEWKRQVKRQREEPVILDLRSPKRKARTPIKITQNSTASHKPVFITSPSQDHTYSAAGASSNNGKTENEDGFHSDESSGVFMHGDFLRCELGDEIGNGDQNVNDLEERRKIAEGADALLNLAGIRMNTLIPALAPSTPTPQKSQPFHPPSAVPVPRRGRKTRHHKRPVRHKSNNNNNNTLSNNNNISNNNNTRFKPWAKLKVDQLKR